MGIRNRDEIGGHIDEAAGTVKEKVGRAIGDRELEQQGAADRTAGKFRAGVGKLGRKVGEIADEVADDLKKP